MAELIDELAGKPMGEGPQVADPTGGVDPITAGPNPSPISEAPPAMQPSYNEIRDAGTNAFLTQGGTQAEADAYFAGNPDYGTLVQDATDWAAGYPGGEDAAKGYFGPVAVPANASAASVPSRFADDPRRRGPMGNSLMLQLLQNFMRNYNMSSTDNFINLGSDEPTGTNALQRPAKVSADGGAGISGGGDIAAPSIGLGGQGAEGGGGGTSGSLDQILPLLMQYLQNQGKTPTV